VLVREGPKPRGLQLPGRAQGPGSCQWRVNVHVIAASTDLTSRNSYAAAHAQQHSQAGSTRTTFIQYPTLRAQRGRALLLAELRNEGSPAGHGGHHPGLGGQRDPESGGRDGGNMLFQTNGGAARMAGRPVGFSIGQTDPNTPYTSTAAWSARDQERVQGRSRVPPSADDPAALEAAKGSSFSGRLGACLADQVNSDTDGTIDSGTENALLWLGDGRRPERGWANRAVDAGQDRIRTTPTTSRLTLP